MKKKNKNIVNEVNATSDEKTFIKKALFILSIIIFVTIPFLNDIINNVIAQVLWYPSLVLCIIFAITSSNKNDDLILDSPLADYVGKWGLANVFIIFQSIFVFRYYNIDKLWNWIIFAYIAIYSTLFFVSILNFEIKENLIPKEKHTKATINIFKCIILYLFLDIFYISIVNKRFMITSVFGLLSLIIIFVGLINAFLNSDKTLLIYEIVELVIGLGLTVYLIYIIPNNTLQQIILALTGAVYGGIFTLVGVAWTFKKSDEARQDDIKRMEFERREEERKKLVPYLSVSNNGAMMSLNSHIRSGIDLNSKEDLEKIHNNRLYSISIKNFNVKNISESNIIIKAIIINDEQYAFEDYLVEKNCICEIKTTENYSVSFANEISSIKLIVSDILMHQYIIDCTFRVNYNSNFLYGIAENDEGVEFKVFNVNYAITNVSIPKLVSSTNRIELNNI